MKQDYPSAVDKFWMRPGSDLCDWIGPYSLLAVKSYGTAKREATYACICLRCGTLHEIKRTKLQALARAQKRRGLPFFRLHGSCPNCDESQAPHVTFRQYLLHKLAANGIQVAHVICQRGDTSAARVRICNMDGSPTVAEVGKPSGPSERIKVQIDATGLNRWLANPDAMLDMLISDLNKAGIKNLYYKTDDGREESLHLPP